MLVAEASCGRMYPKVPQQLSHKRGDDVDESGSTSVGRWLTRSCPDLVLEAIINLFGEKVLL